MYLPNIRIAWLLGCLALACPVAVGAATGEIVIASTPGHSQMAFSAASDGQHYLVALQDGEGCPGPRCSRHIAAQLLTVIDGSLVGAPISTALQGGLPAVAFDGSRYLLVTRRDDGGSDGPRVVGQFIGASGVPEGSEVEISDALARLGGDHDRVQIVFDGSNYLVVWEDRIAVGSDLLARVFGRFVSPAGELLGSLFQLSDDSAGDKVLPVVGVSGESILVAWADARIPACYTDRKGVQTCYPASTYGQLLGKSASGLAGTLSGSNVLIPIFGYGGDFPRDRPMAIASDGTDFLVIAQIRNGLARNCPWYGCVWGVYAGFVNQGGGLIDQSTWVISNYLDNAFPAVLWNPETENYLISLTRRLGAADIEVSTSYFSGARKSIIGGPTLALTASGRAPWAAVPLANPDSGYFTLVNRGKTGKDIGDMARITASSVYAVFMAELLVGQGTVPDPPALIYPGLKFGAGDTTVNQGKGPAPGQSTTVYLLSPTPAYDEQIGFFGEVGERAVPALQAGDASDGKARLSVPLWLDVSKIVPGQSYHLLACANADLAVAVADMTRYHCAASSGKAMLELPDVVVDGVSPSKIRVPKSKSPSPPHSLTIADTVSNQAAVPLVARTKLGYYLSSGSDPEIVLPVTRTLPALPANRQRHSSGKVTARLPLAGLDKFGSYNVVVCGNDPNIETNWPSSGKNHCTPAPVDCAACHTP